MAATANPSITRRLNVMFPDSPLLNSRRARERNGIAGEVNPMRAKTIAQFCEGVRLRAKKDGTNGLAVRAGRPVTQTTSSSDVIRRDHSITGIFTRYYRFP